MKVVYIADIADDVDDVIAVEYLHINGALDYYIVDDPDMACHERVSYLDSIGAIRRDIIADNTPHILVGGSLKLVAEYLNRGNKIDTLIMNGGFAGKNIVESHIALKKFRNKNYVRTYNFNRDPKAAEHVLYHKGVELIYLISKNVCHSARNTYGDIHNDSFLESYNLGMKRLHDLLAVKEGLNILKNRTRICEYRRVNVVNTGLNGIYTEWGCFPNPVSNTKITIKIK